MKEMFFSEMGYGDIEEMDRIAKLSFPTRYNINKKALEDKLIKDADFFKEGSFVVKDKTGKALGFIGTKISNVHELYPDFAWISILAVDKEYRGRGIGTALLKRALDKLKEKGIKNISAGQEFKNFFSGIPEPDEANTGFFKKNNFTVADGEHWDVEAVIKGNKLIEDYKMPECEKEFRIDTYNGEKEKLISFLEREFPDRWLYEVETAIKKNKDKNEIVILFTKDKSEVVGFCILNSYKDESGNKTNYGGLGPIGIAKSVRGRGAGLYLLHGGLLQSEKNGINRVNIDWTSLKDFYGIFGFKPERTYKSAYLELQTSGEEKKSE